MGVDLHAVKAANYTIWYHIILTISYVPYVRRIMTPIRTGVGVRRAKSAAGGGLSTPS